MMIVSYAHKDMTQCVHVFVCKSVMDWWSKSSRYSHITVLDVGDFI